MFQMLEVHILSKGWFLDSLAIKWFHESMKALGMGETFVNTKIPNKTFILTLHFCFILFSFEKYPHS